MMPFRISLTGTNCCVAPAGVVAIPGYDNMALLPVSTVMQRSYRAKDTITPLPQSTFGAKTRRHVVIPGILLLLSASGRNVQRPREFRESSPGELRGPVRRAGRHIRGRRSGGRGALLRRARLLMFPEEELRAGVIVESGLEHLDEWLAVHFIEGERCGEPRHRQREKNGYHDMQIDEEGDAEPARAGEVDELSQGQRPDDLVLDLDELRHLVLHSPQYSSRRRQHMRSGAEMRPEVYRLSRKIQGDANDRTFREVRRLH